DFKVLETTYNNQNTIFKYSYNNNEYSVNSSLLGDYNVYNMLSCIAVLTLMNININDILKNIPLLKSADGRLDIVKYDTNSIIVDYAHTPDAISKVISAIKPITKGNLYTVFGCTGDRDRTKRPIMMNIVTSNCKYAIVTMDDPHNEDPMHVVDDMLENNKNNNYEVIINRGDAIKKGISLLEENDSLLVLGKGHEEFIIYGKERIPFNDKKEIEKIIKELEK
ncbi:MAG TPA: cyanophycin synthetase, partial [Bacilli bacterium]|nr:cyanophycin synthetase [Bacilli bacterium]